MINDIIVNLSVGAKANSASDYEAFHGSVVRRDRSARRDLKDIGTGQWWNQIEEAIAGRDNLEHVVLIVSPAALASKIVEREWRLARRHGHFW